METTVGLLSLLQLQVLLHTSSSTRVRVQINNRPKIAINYTDVQSVSVSPSGSTTDADTGVQFIHTSLTMHLGGMIGEDVVWSLTSASSGTINSTGYFTPSISRCTNNRGLFRSYLYSRIHHSHARGTCASRDFNHRSVNHC